LTGEGAEKGGHFEQSAAFGILKNIGQVLGMLVCVIHQQATVHHPPQASWSSSLLSRISCLSRQSPDRNV
jgi:hypothetical protein